MKIYITVIQDPETGKFFEHDTIEYEGKFWLVTRWLPGPTIGTERPEKLICLENYQLDKPNHGYQTDFVLRGILSKEILAGHSIAGGPVVLDRPDVIRHVGK